MSKTKTPVKIPVKVTAKTKILVKPKGAPPPQEQPPVPKSVPPRAYQEAIEELAGAILGITYELDSPHLQHETFQGTVAVLQETKRTLEELLDEAIREARESGYEPTTPVLSRMGYVNHLLALDNRVAGPVRSACKHAEQCLPQAPEVPALRESVEELMTGSVALARQAYRNFELPEAVKKYLPSKEISHGREDDDTPAAETA